MKRIASSNVAEDLFGPGKDGFQPGNPALNLFATFFTDDWCNDVQEELMNSIEASGQAENGASRTQLLEAIRRIAGRKVGTATPGAGALTFVNAGLIPCDASTGNINMTLPPANVAPGMVFRFMRIDSSGNTVTVSRAGADTLQGGGTSLTIPVGGEVVEFVSDGTSKWFVIGANSGVPIGVPIPMTSMVLPAGYIWADGSVLSRATYSRLWTHAQGSSNLVSEATWTANSWGSYSSGDGASTFRIPDLRGEWLQVLDQGRGVDAGRVIGTWLDQAIQSHSHSGVVLMVAGGDDGDISGYAVHGESTGGRALAAIDGSYVGAAGGALTKPRGLAFPVALRYV